MDVNLHSNELEARFRLRLFTFLRSQEDLKQLISNDPTNSTQSSTIKYSQLRLELGRFLAAYYLNFSFPLLFKNIKKLDISLKGFRFFVYGWHGQEDLGQRFFHS